MFRIFPVIITLLLCASADAQRRFAVIDMETKMLLRDVTVTWGDQQTVSIWDGTFTLDSIPDDITLSKPSYMTRQMKGTEMTDTIELLPAHNRLAEVVVWGTNKKGLISFSMPQLTKEELALDRGGQTGFDVDIMGGIENLLTYKRRKRTAKAKANIANY